MFLKHKPTRLRVYIIYSLLFHDAFQVWIHDFHVIFINSNNELRILVNFPDGRSFAMIDTAQFHSFACHLTNSRFIACRRFQPLPGSNVRGYHAPRALLPALLAVEKFRMLTAALMLRSWPALHAGQTQLRR